MRVNLPISKISNIHYLVSSLFFLPGKATSFERSDIKKLLSVFSSNNAYIAITALLNYNIGKYLVGSSI